MERELWAYSQRGDSFVSTNLAMAAHRTTVAAPTHPPTGQGPASTDYMALFDGHFDNLAAATNSGAALDQLAATTTMQYAEIKPLLTALKTTYRPSSYAAADSTDSTPSIPPTEAKRCIRKLKAAIRKNWHCGAFCSTHGWGVNKNHTSKNCRAKSPAMCPLVHVRTLQAW